MSLGALITLLVVYILASLCNIVASIASFMKGQTVAGYGFGFAALCFIAATIFVIRALIEGDYD